MQKLLDPDEMLTFLSPNGSLSQITDTYEMRGGQLELLRHICKCFNEELIGAFEAGTGIGKSFAYLIPAIMLAKIKKTRIILSTATINLQNQLLKKDIPLVFSILGIKEEDVRVALVKGRGNYLCLRKLEEKMSDEDFFQKKMDIADLEEDKKDLKILYEWSNKTPSGDREDLKEKIKNETWSEVCAESDTCLGSLCPYIAKCFVAKMKNNAENALIVVSNHHIVFADVRLKMEEGEGLAEDDIKDDTKDDDENKRAPSILPPFTHIIFDEAHSIKNTAINFFSQNISKKELKRYLSLLYIETTRKKKRGIIVELSYVKKDVILKEYEHIQNVVLDVYQNLETFAFNILIGKASSPIASSNTSSIEELKKDEKEELIERFKKFYHALLELTKYLSKTLASIDEEELKEEKHMLHLVLRKMKNILTTTNNFLMHKTIEDDVFWFEKKKQYKEDDALIFTQTPLNVAIILKIHLFSKLTSAINLSATLQVGHRFSYFLNGVGLGFGALPIETNVFPSPFLYEEKVLLCIPKNIPLPQENDFQEELNSIILSLIEATEGRALVLFTSVASLKDASIYVKNKIHSNINIYTQGDGEKSFLLAKFKEDINSCLFATMSFWEGIDVPGEALTHLILTKLPFTIPNHPVTLARGKALERRGFNSFTYLQMPEALILFRQGFGRLIRNQKDKGVVTVLDKRILTKTYGKSFLNSIPKTQRCFANLGEIIYNIKEFIKEKE